MQSSFYDVPVPLDGGAATWSPKEVSASTVAATAVGTGHHMLKLEGYSMLKATHARNGSYIESSAFKAGGHTWTIRCYLNGESMHDAGFVSLFLHLCGSRDAFKPVVHATYEFALVPHHHGGGAPVPPAPETTTTNGHQLGEPIKTTTHGVCSLVNAFGGGFDNTCGSWGQSRFISVEELERSSFLKDDCFAVRCTVTVVEEQPVKEKTLQLNDMARLGMLICKCDDDLCKRHHTRPAADETFLERFAKFCYFPCIQ